MNKEPDNDNKKKGFDFFDFFGLVFASILLFWFQRSEYYQAILDWL